MKIPILQYFFPIMGSRDGSELGGGDAPVTPPQSYDGRMLVVNNKIWVSNTRMWVIK